MTTYRTGNNWGVTIVREGHGEPNPSNCGLVDDELVAVVVNGDRDLAERICAGLNGEAELNDAIAGWTAPRPIAEAPATVRKPRTDAPEGTPSATEEHAQGCR